MRKQPAVPPTWRLALLALLLFPLSCKKTVRNDAYYEAVSQYVYAYTSGAIGREEPVRVRFVNAAVAHEQIGQPVDAAIFSVEPAIPGQAVWADDRTIVLTPSEPLPYGRAYKGRINLARIYQNVPPAAQTFEFDFAVRQLSFDVSLVGLRAENASDLRRQTIVGQLSTSDAIDPTAVEKLLSARQGNKNLNITWNHGADGVTHAFTVQGVERSNARSRVELAWSGESLGIATNGKTEQLVPALDEFTVLSARVEQTDEQVVLLNFSDPIDPQQDLTGLVRITDVETTVRTVVDGNFVRVYPAQRITGEHSLRVEAGVRNTAGAAMKERFDATLVFEDLKPAVRLVGRGAIIPQQSGGAVIFPFEAVGLNAVDVEVFKVFNSNILQHLQVNDIEGEQELDRVGKIILQKRYSLRDLNPNANLKAWQRYALDLKDIISKDPGALYQVRIAFHRGYTEQECQAQGSGAEDRMNPQAEDELIQLGHIDDNGILRSIMGGYRGRYYQDYGGGFFGGDEEWWGESDDYDWSRREDPCYREYYNNERFARRNVFVSDLGLTAKRGRDGSLFLAATDLHTAGAVGGVNIEFYSYQLQKVGAASTGADGTAFVENLAERPFLAVASQGGRRGYIRLHDGNSLSLSRFDVAGVELQKGLKGYLYGERGVWRPGDSLYLDFVLEDKQGTLPAGHPVTLELTDPRGALQQRVVTTRGVNGVYALHTATPPGAPTGNWTANVKVGGATFSKTLKIETVKPNRLRMNLDFGKKALSPDDENLKGQLQVNWLHGAVAKNLKARVELQVRRGSTEFPNFKDFVFDDPARSFTAEPQVLYDANIDDQGRASVPLKLANENAAPGKLIANFRVRVFEPGGDFSTDNFALDYHPYDRYVGIYTPRSRWGDKTIDRNGGQVQFAVVDKNGKPVPGHKIEVGLYRVDWRWWWDEDANSGVSQFNSADDVSAVDKTVLTTDQRGLATWKVRAPQWGRYLVRATDTEGQHAAGDFFWSGYPDDKNDMRMRNAVAMLPFSVEKEKYLTGEEVTLKVPAGDAGRILLTLENGSRVVRHLWFDVKAGDNMLKFTADETMAPTVYAHVSLIQPHAQTKNDLPIRMYGVMPVNIENPQTRLQPQLDMPDVIRPGENFTVAVRETSGKACAYTLALVDEGLLDLTRFETPNPWTAFFAREALGVKTWDIYDYVLGAYGAELERILSVGGDGINQKARNGAQVNRFKPAVIHLGPFYLQKGQTAKHTLKLDNYVGSVRAMLVCSAPAAGGRGAYGSTEKAVPVRKPLMLLPTLPRVLSPGESLRLPVNVFAMEKQVKNATVRVREGAGLVQVSGDSKTLTFNEPGEQMAYFDLKVGQRTGPAKFVITAQGGGETATQEIELLVRNPNPVVSEIIEGTVEPGAEWTGRFDASKYTDIESAVVEVSALPPINFSRHLDFLIRYPYGCVEQTTSSAFPQLYVDVVAPLTEKQKQDVGRNVTAAIQSLRNYQNASGGFSYWPGSAEINDWSSVYVGHFLVEAKAKGYTLPPNMLENWVTNQQRLSRQWNVLTAGQEPWRTFDHDHTQAYRLYTLAMAGKADLAGMNRLRERKDLYVQSAGLLAAAYALAGKPEAAREVLATKWRDDWHYNWHGYTYGSDLRDRALLLETYLASGDQARADNIVTAVCNDLGNANNWYWTTQTLATSLRALSKYAARAGGSTGITYSYRLGNSGGYQSGPSAKLIGTVDYTDRAGKDPAVSVKNTSGGKLYTRVIVRARPAMGAEKTQNANLAVSVRYLDTKGQAVDVNKLAQGTDFVAEVTVKRQSTFEFPFTELALEQVFPAGWEILNSRMNLVSSPSGGGQVGAPAGGGQVGADYQDVRDDRVFTFFDIPEVNGQRGRAGSAPTRVYRFQLTAAYAGRYYLPAVTVGAMYDERIRASAPGRWVEVI